MLTVVCLFNVRGPMHLDRHCDATTSKQPMTLLSMYIWKLVVGNQQNCSQPKPKLRSLQVGMMGGLSSSDWYACF